MDFERLIDNKNYYWVEVIEYKIPACRILITDKDRGSLLSAYDPTLKDGPWWYDPTTNQHYWNDKDCCLEFMIEAPVGLKGLQRFEFVKHHPSYCAAHRFSPQRCSELGFPDAKGGAYFLARAIVTGTDLTPMFSQLDQQNSFLEMYIKMGLTHLLFGLTRGKDPSGTICHGCPESVAYCKAMMAAYTYGRRDEAEFFAQMFKGFRELAQTAAAIMKAFTGIEVSAND